MKLGSNLDFNRLQSLNRVIQNLSTPPTSPLPGLEYYDTGLNSSFEWNGTSWIPRNAALMPAGTIPITALTVNPLDRANHTGTQLASTISNLQSTVQAYTLNSFATPTGNIDMGGYTLTNLNTTPNQAGMAAEYSWVLAQVQASAAGIDSKPSVVAVSASNIATLSGTMTIDGIALAVGDRVLLVGQTDATQNGSYVVASAAWSRSTDTITPQAFWFAEQGTQYQGTQWKVSTSGTITIGTTSITINQFGASINYTAGNGLSLAGTVFSIQLVTNSGLVASGAGLGVQLQSASGLQLGSTGLAILPQPTNSGLVVDSTGVAIDPTYIARKFAQTIGDGTTNNYTVTHNLNNQDVTVQVRDTASNSVVIVDIAMTNANSVTISFAQPPATNAYRVVVIG